MRALMILVVALALAVPAAAEVPSTLSYQGVLRDNVGDVVPDDDYIIDFRIYDAEVAGTLHWSELLTVSTSDGVFNAVLGEATVMHIDFDAQYWLALSVAGEAELAPRVKLTAAPYAHRAATANELRAGGSINVTEFRLTTGAAAGHVLTSDASGYGSWQPAAGTVGGGGTTDFVPMFTAPATLGDSPLAVSASDVGIGTVSPQTKLTVSSMTYDDHLTIERPGDDTGHISIGAGNLLLWMGSGSALAVNGSGNVGVGVTAPASRLDVAGTAQMTGFRMPTGAADGSLLVSDASGNGTWQELNDGLTLPYYGQASVDSHAFHVRNESGSGGGGMFFIGSNGTEPAVTGLSYGSAPGVFGRAYGGSYGGDFRTSGVSGTPALYVSAGGGTGLAGEFWGDVEVSGTISKGGGSFKIDHPLDPENMYLSHSFVESPDMMNVYNGNVMLDVHGEAWVELPGYFDALNREFRYQLTPVGAAAPNLHIADRISGNRFRIAGGEPGLEVSWQVTGVRRDKFAEEYRIQVEEDKRPRDRGKYLHPELFGLQEEDGVHYAEPPLEHDAEMEGH